MSDKSWERRRLACKTSDRDGRALRKVGIPDSTPFHPGYITNN